MAAIIKNIASWVVWSSKNPDKISRTIKWGISAVLVALTWGGVDTSVIQPAVVEAEGQLTSVVMLAIQFMGNGIELVTQLGTLWFAIAKIVNSIKSKENYEPIL